MAGGSQAGSTDEAPETAPLETADDSSRQAPGPSRSLPITVADTAWTIRHRKTSRAVWSGRYNGDGIALLNVVARMARFAVLVHDHPFLHWDLLLEEGAALRAFRLLRPLEQGARVVAQPLPAHRLMYLDYEGPVGGDRGAVARCDRGTYERIEDGPARLVVRIAGERWRGRLTLTAPGSGDQADGDWSASFEAEPSEEA